MSSDPEEKLIPLTIRLVKRPFALRGRRSLRDLYTPSVGAPVGRDQRSFCRPSGAPTARGGLCRFEELVFPAEGGGDLLGEGEGIEGFEEDSCEAETGEAPLIDSLNLCGEQEDRDMSDGGSLLHSGEGGGAVDAGHHDIHENGVGLFGGGDVDSFSSGAGGENIPACGGFQRQCGYFTNVIFVVNYENTSHERVYSLM